MSVKLTSEEKKERLLYYDYEEMLSLDQLKQVKKGLDAGVNVGIYADRRYSGKQMEEIRLGLEAKVDVYQYLKPTMRVEDMRYIRRELQKRQKARDKKVKK